MSKQFPYKPLLTLFLSFSLLFTCCGCGSVGSTDNHSFSIGEAIDAVKSVFVGDQTEEKYERVKSDLEKFQGLLTSYMEDNGDKCSGGGITAEGINMYLDQDTIMVVSDKVESTTANSKLTDPWWHNYRIEIVNDRDGGNTVGYGTDKAYIYVYSGGPDKKYGTEDESNDDCVLVMQYSNSVVYSRILMPSDLESDASSCSENNYEGKYHNELTAVKQQVKSNKTSRRAGSRY